MHMKKVAATEPETCPRGRLKGSKYEWKPLKMTRKVTRWYTGVIEWCVRSVCLVRQLIEIYPGTQTGWGDHGFIPQTMILFVPSQEYIYSHTGK
jgi:hypothetical protein